MKTCVINSSNLSTKLKTCVINSANLFTKLKTCVINRANLSTKLKTCVINFYTPQVTILRKFLRIFPRNLRKFTGIFHRKIWWKCLQQFRGISRNPFLGISRNPFWCISLSIKFNPYRTAKEMDNYCLIMELINTKVVASNIENMFNKFFKQIVILTYSLRMMFHMMLLYFH